MAVNILNTSTHARPSSGLRLKIRRSHRTVRGILPPARSRCSYSRMLWMRRCGKRAASSTSSDQSRNLQRTCAASVQIVESNLVKGILPIGLSHESQILRGFSWADMQADASTTHLTAYRGSGVPTQPIFTATYLGCLVGIKERMTNRHAELTGIQN